MAQVVSLTPVRPSPQPPALPPANRHGSFVANASMRAGRRTGNHRLVCPHTLICTPSLPTQKNSPHGHSPPHCPLPPNDPSQLLTITLTSQKTHHTHAASQPLSPHGLRCASPFEATGHSIMPPPHAAARRRTHSYPTLHRLASPHHMRAHPRPLVGVLAGGL